MLTKKHLRRVPIDQLTSPRTEALWEVQWTGIDATRTVERDPYVKAPVGTFKYREGFSEGVRTF